MSTEKVKVSRRGIANSAKKTILRFHEKDAVANGPAMGLFVGHIATVEVTKSTIKEDAKGLQSFAGKEIPRLVLRFESGTLYLVHHDIYHILPLPLAAVELSARDGVGAVVVDGDAGFAAHIGDMRSCEQQPQSHLPVIPARQIDVPSIGLSEEFTSDGIALGCQLPMKNVVGEQVSLMEWCLALAPIRENKR